MNYNVNGISRTVPEWAATLGVTEEAINYELRCGKPMREVVQQFQTDTFAARHSLPALQRPSLSTFHSGLKVPGVKQEHFSVTGTCRSCMAIARDEYDALHKAHVIGVEDERRAEIKAGKQAER